jgi:phage head maturation protease
VTLIASAFGSSSGPSDDDSSPNELRLTAAPVEIAAAAGEGKLPRFSMRAYDGSLMQLEGFFWPVVVDLDGARARKRVKAFYEHDMSRVVGHADKVKIDGSGIGVEGVISGTGAHVAEIIANAKNGFEYEASIGASVIRREFVEAGKSVDVNGSTFQGPVIVARETEIYEASFTAIGAAADSSAHVAATSKENTMTFEQWLTAQGFDPATLTAAQTVTLRAAYDARAASRSPGSANAAQGQGASAGNAAPAPDAGGGTATATATPPVQASAAANGAAQQQSANNGNGHQVNATDGAIDAIRNEHLRIASINRICAAHGNPRITHNDQEVELQAHAIAQGLTAEQTELHALRAARPQAAPFANVGGRQGAPDSARVIEAAMCITAGCGEEYLGRHYDQNTMNAAQASQMRGFGIAELLFASLRANGGHVHRSRLDADTIRAALQTDPLLHGGQGIRASFSTVSLSGILSNVANRAMLERFDSLESVVSEIAFETDTNNFKPFYRYRLDGKGNLSEVGPDGELKHIELTESEYQNQLATHGGMIGLTRQMIIDDDLGAFLQIPLIFVEMAVHARELIAFTILLANAGTFFGSGNGNYIEGADTVLSIGALDEAVAKYREQKHKGERFIMISPTKLLVPPALEATAKQIFASTELRGPSTASKQPTANHHRGAFKPVVSPYLSEAGGLSGASNTAWYLLTEPQSGHAVIQLGYLQGARRPTIESGQPDFNILGVLWRAYWDFGAALHEPRAGVKSKGAA